MKLKPPSRTAHSKAQTLCTAESLARRLPRRRTTTTMMRTTPTRISKLTSCWLGSVSIGMLACPMRAETLWSLGSLRLQGRLLQPSLQAKLITFSLCSSTGSLHVQRAVQMPPLQTSGGPFCLGCWSCLAVVFVSPSFLFKTENVPSAQDFLTLSLDPEKLALELVLFRSEPHVLATVQFRKLGSAGSG